MNKIVVHGHKMCPDTQNLIKTFTENGIEFTFRDMAEGVPQVKEFILLRETRKEFDKIKDAGYLGIPCVVINDGEKVLFEDLSLDELK